MKELKIIFTNKLLQKEVTGRSSVKLPRYVQESTNNGQPPYESNDGNGNVSEYLDANGIVQAHFEYDAFGRTVASSGLNLERFSFRFSTKYEDGETGLLYYGYRYYDSAAGRWLSRDPINEQGGINLYGFVENGGVNGIDLLGRDLMGWLSGSSVRQNGNGSAYAFGHNYDTLFDDPSEDNGPSPSPNKPDDCSEAGGGGGGGGGAPNRGGTDWRRFAYDSTLGPIVQFGNAGGAYLSGAWDAALKGDIILAGLNLVATAGKVGEGLLAAAGFGVGSATTAAPATFTAAESKLVNVTADQAKNLARFEKSLPGVPQATVLRPLPNSGVAAQANVPGRVPGSFATYEKQIDATGKTIQFTKTTVDPTGNIIHVKDKISGVQLP